MKTWNLHKFTLYEIIVNPDKTSWSNLRRIFWQSFHSTSPLRTINNNPINFYFPPPGKAIAKPL